MKLERGAHLTYCTSIHRGEHWSDVERNLREHVTAVRSRFPAEHPFGVGLWLSASAANSLVAGGKLSELQALLREHGMYVFTLNGFPYGAFHGGPVKTRVYHPDWRDPARLQYTDSLADLLAELLPAGMDGSISTLPGGEQALLRGDTERAAVADNLFRHVAHLHALEQRSGKRIALAIEPEPCCMLETIDEAIAFFDGQLRGERALRRLADLTGESTGAAAAMLQRHIGLCLDTCHAAVEFEDAATLVRKLRAAELPIVKLQLSSGLRLLRADAPTRAALEPFLDPVYLHQVVARHGERLTRYLDLPDALVAEPTRDPGEWRIHFHVPVFIERMAHFESTQFFLREILALHRQQPLSTHLEVETYMWDILPESARQLPLPDAIARELRFCLDQLGLAA